MKIIVGIGNPGPEYARTRHNVGFMVADFLAVQHSILPWRQRFNSLAAEGTIKSSRVLLLKPETYMNLSGRAVRAAMDWCKVQPQDVMIICDDLNLPLGRLRVRGDGSSGGHNGLNSIFEHLGTKDVPRLRIGIGRDSGGRARDYVLSTFSSDEREPVDAAVRRAAHAIEVWLDAGLKRCQNEFNAGPDVKRNTREEGDA